MRGRRQGRQIGTVPARRALLARAGIAAAGGAAGALGTGALYGAVATGAGTTDANTSHWSGVLAPAGPPLAQDLDADVAIIGGGFTGLSAAYYLASTLPGRRVVLLDARRCGNGASARNGAMLLPSTADRYLVASGDPALDRRIHELTVDNLARLRALELATGIDAEIDLTGALCVLRTPEAAAQARTTALRLQDAGIGVVHWDAAHTAAAIGTARYAGALFCPDAGQVHPGRLVNLWRRAAELAGAQIHEQTPVVGIDEGRTLVLHTATGHRVRAPLVVLATNVYGARLGYLTNAAVPVWDYVAMSAPLDAARLAALGWHSRAPYNDDVLQTWYLGITRDQRVHIGGGPVDYVFNGGAPDAAQIAERGRALGAELVRLYPALEGVPLQTAWGGAVDMSLDQTPALGRMGRHANLLYAIGYSGHGVNLSSVFGRILADLAAGHDGAWRWLPYLDRLPPFVPGEPLRWLGLRTGLAALRMVPP